MTTKPKRVRTKAPQTACISAGALGRNVLEEFLVDLTRAWKLYGKETLDRMATEQPLIFLETMINLIGVADQLDQPIDFGPRNRHDVLRRPQPQLVALF